MDKLDEVLLEGPSDGQLVTLIHGWPDDLHLWDDIVQDLLSTVIRSVRLLHLSEFDKPFPKISKMTQISRKSIVRIS